MSVPCKSSVKQTEFFFFFLDVPCFNRETECLWKVLLRRNFCSAARALPCAIGTAGSACQFASTVEQCALHRYWCPAHHRAGEMETCAQSDSFTEWTDGRAGGRHWRQTQTIRDCSDTAGAHTAPLPFTKKRKWLLQEKRNALLTRRIKRGEKTNCARAPRRRKDLLKLDYWHLNPIVHNDYYSAELAASCIIIWISESQSSHSQDVATLHGHTVPWVGSWKAL